MRQTNSPQPVASNGSVGDRPEPATASAPRPAVRPRWEWPVVIGMLLLAAAFRVLALNDVPPGLHHDEVIIGQIAKDILRGQLAIYFTPGYGHEPLYHYLLAGMFAAIGATDFALRLTSAFVAILGLAVAYRFTRRLFAPAVAISALGWMAVSLWPIFFARVGLRGITLPLMAGLTAYWLWRALRLPSSNQQVAFITRPRHGVTGAHPSSLILHPSSFILPGIFLGLTLYTYQASRVFPIIFLLLTLYVSLFHRDLFRRAWRGLIVFFVAAGIITAPLVFYLTLINPAAEQRIAELSGPLAKLATGDASEVIQSTLNTLGMFTVRGDGVPIYNMSGRPVFPEPLGAALFYAGLAICVWHWRRPAHSFMLIWLAISLVPAMLTPFSPNFVRTIAAWPIPFIFCGIAMFEAARLAGRLSRRPFTPFRAGPFSPSPLRSAAMVFTAILAINAILTARDYFLEWPRGDYVRFWQQTTWTQAARFLNTDSSTLPVAASGLSIHDLDPQTFDLLLRRSDFKLEWFDCRNAVLYPGGSAARILTPDFFPCDADLWARYLPGAALIAQPRWPDSGNAIFALHQFDARPLLDSLMPRLTDQAVYVGDEGFDATDPDAGLETAALPIDFDGLRFLGRATDRDAWRPGETALLDTYWTVTTSLAPPLKLFVHITAPDGSILAQHDGLDIGVAQLEPGDVFVQRHRIPFPPDAAPGAYRISLGAYHSDTDSRLTAPVGTRTIDALILGIMKVTR